MPDGCGQCTRSGRFELRDGSAIEVADDGLGARFAAVTSGWPTILKLMAISAFLGTYYGLAFLSVRKCPSFISVYRPLSLQPIESCSKGLENGDHCGRSFRATLNENIFGFELGAFCVENF